MAHTYSIYEAKAKFSEVIRKTKLKQEIIVTERGKPVARVIPFGENKFQDRFEELQAQGLIISAKRKGLFPIGPRRPGGLKRFLEERE